MSDYNTFKCPGCGQFVNSTLANCKFCSLPFDAQIIATAVDRQNRINDAYRSASNTRILAGGMTTAFFVGFVPFIGFLATWAFRIIFLCIPIFLIVWLIKYGSLDTSEPEIKDARKYVLTAFGIWLIYPAIYFVFVILLLLGITAYQLSR